MDGFSYQFFNTTVSAWEEMKRCLSVAKKSIYWEIYALIDDAAGGSFIDILCQKAMSGLDVMLVVDAIGSYELSNKAKDKLKNSGVKFQVFHSLSPIIGLSSWWKRVWHRTHRKVLIIDEEVVFIGGVNIKESARDWYDLHLKVTGRIARPLLYGFARTYINSGGRREEIKHLLHPKLTTGLAHLKDKVNFILHSPIYAAKKSPFKKVYYQTLDMAKESFNLLTPYYVPDREFIELVSKAKKRGVKVNIILPWKTDIKFMEYMARAFYGISQKAGAAFYFLKKMNHGKAVTADDKIGVVGSANFTHRGLFLNQEAGVSFSQKEMIDDLNHILDDWKEEAVPMSDFNFNSKGWYRRFKDWWLNKFKDYV
ncbi:MAG: phosphatidylserine/phosphatidylglycerophosphate/cardiolipin synthase family protein [Patescibacteria group bacterium]